MVMMSKARGPRISIAWNRRPGFHTRRRWPTFLFCARRKRSLQVVRLGALPDHLPTSSSHGWHRASDL